VINQISLLGKNFSLFLFFTIVKEFELIKLACWVKCIFSVEQDVAAFRLVIRQEFWCIVSTRISKYCLYELESWRIKNIVFDDFQLKLVEVKRNYYIHIYIYIYIYIYFFFSVSTNLTGAPDGVVGIFH